MKQKEIQKITKAVREDIVEKVAEDIVRFVRNKDEEVIFLDDNGIRAVVQKELETAGIEPDEDMVDMMVDFVEARLTDKVRKNGYEVHFPYMVYFIGKKWFRAAPNGLTIVKEA